MQTLQISIEKSGVMVPVGIITGNDPADAIFQYSPDYIQDPSAPAISISLPVREKPFSPAETSGFFEGLLPEGFSRRSVAQWMHADESDYISILHGLGRECIGAICVTQENESINAMYELISTDQIQALAAEGATKSTEMISAGQPPKSD